MKHALQFMEETADAITVGLADRRPLWRYVFAPDTPAREATRPYVHPLRTLHGDVLTNFRPNDHPWHHALSFTLSSVDGLNFWGGPTYQPGAGYAWADNHGAQRHRGWTTLTPAHVEQALEWINPRTHEILLRETRLLDTAVEPAGEAWSLRWRTVITNATERDLVLGNYHATGGLADSHYTGLQFRGARGLLDDHGDADIRLTAEGGLSDEAAVHAGSASWMEWHGQLDGSLCRVRIRFENAQGSIPWFVRRQLPLAAFAFHRETPVVLTRGANRRFDHTLTFTDA